MTLADGMLGGIEMVWTECLRMTFRLISRYVPRPRAFDKCESVSTVSHVVPAFFFSQSGYPEVIPCICVLALFFARFVTDGQA